MTVVRTAYRYKRPPRKRQTVALEVPAVVKGADPAKARKRGAKAAQRLTVNRGSETAATQVTNDDRKPAIVTIRSRKHAMLAHLLEDMTPEEHRRRGDAADALFRTVVRRTAGKDRP
jgi:hypothetical protein